MSGRIDKNLDDISVYLTIEISYLLTYLPSQYHSGYQEQMSHWPELPVNIIIKWLKDHGPSLVVADFGCGETDFYSLLASIVKNYQLFTLFLF